MITLLTGGRVEQVDGLVVPAGEPVLGWERKPHGWCRGEACIPAFRAAEAETPEGVDLVRFAGLLSRPVVLDREEGVLAIGEPAELAVDHAPGFALDLPQGGRFELSALRGSKVALVFWASWCGCRYDIPAWDALHRELSAAGGFTLVSVSLDRDPADAAPWIADVAHPALIDAEGVVAELYNIVNVPTVVWVDEEGRIARPQDTMTATDTFRSMNNLSAEAATAALRRWVLADEPGLTAEEARAHLRLPTEEERTARLHARVAAWLFRRGRTAAARRHLDAAAALAPHDVSIRRGLMPLDGVDPFGEAYFELRAELEAAGVPIYRPLPDWQAPSASS
ncbi:peroxiredoxin [Thermocatellispora tengchongensis]|uniref:Peroxiredoxin n=1 Tax=Thermocatellispora tengchongensis TaxID=1073253 RepID=A0A840PLQ3_9ACTN|nr:TlpA disulfide reductase family protein [Thermocatellispora tengchongensis]MBB5138913.1 peroxiredoxin [Thermocatellispora tengchongensis]